MKQLLLLHALSTWSLIGLIWTIQVVHYPLFARVGSIGFASYESAHTSRVSVLVIPLMLTELLTSISLVLYPPPSLAPFSLWIGLGLIGLIWIITFSLAVPQHRRLSLGFDAKAHQALLRSNWIRTVAWSLRGLLVAWWLLSLLR